MPKINTYLTFNGTCEEAFTFYKSVLGGEFAHVGRFSEMPPEHNIPEDAKNMIMHMTLPVGEHNVLMGSDTLESFGGPTTVGDNFSLSIDVDSKEQADAYFAGLSAGGKVSMPMQDTFWNSYFGSFTDKFGIRWMISFAKS